MHFGDVKGAGFVHGKQMGGPQLNLDRLPAAAHAVPGICGKRCSSVLLPLCRRLKDRKPGRSLLRRSAG